MILRRALIAFALSFPFLAFMNCSLDSGNSVPSFPFSNAAYYFQSSTKVTIEVHYEPGAEPFTGNTAQGRPYWSILKENLQAIFQFRSQPPQLEVPNALADMHAMPAQNRAQWTINDILTLHELNALASPSVSDSRFFIYFVNGYYSENGSARPGVIGVNIGSSPIIAIFKDVIENSGMNPIDPVPKFVEQSTLVHEMGHALGLVNLGVPMAAGHEDTAHSGHTLNQDCVMYWLNEGITDLQTFVQKYLTSANVVMWGPEVLADVQQISR